MPVKKPEKKTPKKKKKTVLKVLAEEQRKSPARYIDVPGAR